jgi:hypothetical protein
MVQAFHVVALLNSFFDRKRLFKVPMLQGMSFLSPQCVGFNWSSQKAIIWRISFLRLLATLEYWILNEIYTARDICAASESFGLLHQNPVQLK